MAKEPKPAKQAKIDAKSERVAPAHDDRRAPKTKKVGTKADKHARYLARLDAFELPDMQTATAELLLRPEGLPLDQYAHRLASQHGEDGLTVEIFRRMGVEHRRAVELGCGANGGNAGVLVAGLGFNALLVDGDEALLTHARRLYAGQPANVVHSWISAETVNGLLEKHGFDRNLDYLGIDLDGVDFWVWDALSVRPRLMILEFNPFFGQHAAVTVPYRPDFDRTARNAGGHVQPKGYFGASITALERLGRRKGYRLVGSAPRSSNAYFVRVDVNAGLPEVSASDAWRPLLKGKAETPVADQLRQQIEDEGPHEYFERRGFPLVDVAEDGVARPRATTPTSASPTPLSPLHAAHLGPDASPPR